MGAKERNERYDIPPEGALILVHGRVHEVPETWEGTGPRIGEKGGCYPRHDSGDGTAPTKHVWDEDAPWRPATGQPWDEDRTTPAERGAADQNARPGGLGGRGAGPRGERPHESRTVERLAAAIAGTFDPYPAEYPPRPQGPPPERG